MFGTSLTKKSFIIWYSFVGAYCILMIVLAPFAAHWLSTNFIPEGSFESGFGPIGIVVFNTFVGVTSALGYPLFWGSSSVGFKGRATKIFALVIFGILIVTTLFGNMQWAFGGRITI